MGKKYDVAIEYKGKPDSAGSTGYKSSHTFKTPSFIHLLFGYE